MTTPSDSASLTPYQRMVERRKAARVLITDPQDPEYGRRIVIDPRATHGKRTTYVHWGCECRACTDANSAWHAEYRAARRAANAA